MFEPVVMTLGEIDSALVPVIAIGGGCAVAIVAITFGSLAKMTQIQSREKSRREIAAYVAEGSMTPEEGERLIAAGADADAKSSGCC